MYCPGNFVWNKRILLGPVLWSVKWGGESGVSRVRSKWQMSRVFSSSSGDWFHSLTKCTDSMYFYSFVCKGWYRAFLHLVSLMTLAFRGGSFIQLQLWYQLKKVIILKDFISHDHAVIDEYNLCIMDRLRKKIIRSKASIPKAYIRRGLEGPNPLKLKTKLKYQKEKNLYLKS